IWAPARYSRPGGCALTGAIPTGGGKLPSVRTWNLEAWRLMDGGVQAFKVCQSGRLSWWRSSSRSRSNIAAGASATASLACVPTWIEDFRQDVAGIGVPTLIIHGAQLVRNFIE